MKLLIINFLKEFNEEELIDRNILNSDRKLTERTVLPLIDLMKSRQVYKLVANNGWNLDIDGNYYNNYAYKKEGNVFLNHEYLIFVFYKQDRIINPYHVPQLYSINELVAPTSYNKIIKDSGNKEDNNSFLNAASINYIFRTKIMKGVWLNIREIHAVFENELPLEEGDWEPINNKNSYPKWKRKVHAVLSKLKKAGLIEHNHQNSSYIFPYDYNEKASLFNEVPSGFDLTEIKKKKKARTKSYTNEEATKILKYEHEKFDSTKTYDIFLSHSYLDSGDILMLSEFLQINGYSVYVDWLIDIDMKRTDVSSETAKTIRDRMKSCRCLLFAASDNSSTSRWMPWELGYFDGKNGKVAIIHVTEKRPFSGAVTGQEYLDLYEVIDRLGKRFLVHKTEDESVDFKHWITSG
jgi:hypothetical protein